MAGTNKTALERFMAPIAFGDCWERGGWKNNNGYGFIRDGKRYLAHRWSYETFVGPIGGSCVLHRCDNPSCVNPDHLFLGSRADNNADMAAKGRARAIAKVTEGDVVAIRADTRPQRVVAREYGVTQSAISRIKSRKNWGRVA